jgi:hypothetical protein
VAGYSVDYITLRGAVWVPAGQWRADQTEEVTIPIRASCALPEGKAIHVSASCFSDPHRGIQYNSWPTEDGDVRVQLGPGAGTWYAVVEFTEADEQEYGGQFAAVLRTDVH